MSKPSGMPFAMLIQTRAQDVERTVREAMKVMERYAGVSSRKTITLDEAAWLGAICYLGLNEAAKTNLSRSVDIQTGETNVHNVVAGSGTEVKSDAS